MQRCKDMAARRRSPNLAVAPMDAEDNVPAWQRCPLTLEEYDALLTGNIMRNTAERQVLWSVIDAQLKNGHPRSTRYLMMAVDATNIQALDALLDRGWSINGTWRNYFHMPLQRTTRRWNANYRSGKKPHHRHLLALTELHGIEGPPELAGPALQTHSDIYHEYHRSRESYAYALYDTKMSAAATLLSERGARVSPFAGVFVDISRFKGYTTRGDTIIAWFLILHTLAYVAILPLAIVYGTDRYGTWEGMTRGQKFGFVYLWALLSYLMPHWGLFGEADGFTSTGGQVLWLLLCLATFIFNHVGLPYLVIAHRWRPFQSCEYFVDNGALGKTCTNLSFLLPMAVGGVEAIGGVVAFVVLDW
ncbi:hypothetical protein B0T11DRAFT_323827 [Plectosphaerella cucumerina]|uniref:Uncharacterized protein n=1 Tax=Plectosphaerella cucumerina TaxID=40658 RepID=A0A8K0X8Z4_9PEZI|nr:hypothetical protein B0T11DRAFT_323827 [Plectosphaerella cucumerina]